jgi:hypothetical protein
VLRAGVAARVRLIVTVECFVEAPLAPLCLERRGVRALAVLAWLADDRVRDGWDRLIPRAGRPFFTPPLSGPNPADLREYLSKDDAKVCQSFFVA